jgi:hypothetical protein
MLDGSGRFLSEQESIDRIRKLVLTGKGQASTITGVLSEDITARRLIDGTAIDKLSGSIPDLSFTYEGDPGFCEVKTSSASTSMVFKREQARHFLDYPNCFFAFTRHTIDGVQQKTKTLAGRAQVRNEFSLDRNVIISAEEAWKVYNLLNNKECYLADRDLYYKHIRIGNLIRYATEKKLKTHYVPELNTLLIGTARKIDLVIDQPTSPRHDPILKRQLSKMIQEEKRQLKSLEQHQ